MNGFQEIARQVYLWRYPVLDVNVTLIVGDGAALLVDTLSTDAQARELADAVSRITAAPRALVNTHHHFDHCFGNAVLAMDGQPIWAHDVAAAQLRERGAHWQRVWYEQWLTREPALAEGLAAVTIRPPTDTVRRAATLDVGGRNVTLRYFGRGHTAGDLVVDVPDADLTVVGDLVETSGPPDFADGYPLDWPETLAALLDTLTTDTVVVPGHGPPVDTGSVAAQHTALTEVDWLIREGHADDVPVTTVAARCPFGPDAALSAVTRGYAQLSGAL